MKYMYCNVTFSRLVDSSQWLLASWSASSQESVSWALRSQFPDTFPLIMICFLNYCFLVIVSFQNCSFLVIVAYCCWFLIIARFLNCYFLIKVSLVAASLSRSVSLHHGHVLNYCILVVVSFVSCYSSSLSIRWFLLPHHSNCGFLIIVSFLNYCFLFIANSYLLLLHHGQISKL